MNSSVSFGFGNLFWAEAESQEPIIDKAMIKGVLFGFFVLLFVALVITVNCEKTA